MALVIRDLLALVAAVQSALSANLEPDGPNDHETLCTLLGLMDSAEQRAAEAQARQDKTDAKLGRDAAALLPGTAYMDPPDGGSVTVLEQLQRMAADAAKWRARHGVPPAPGVHRLLDLVAQAQAALSANLEPNGPGDEETIDKLLGLFDSPEQRAAEGQAQQDETHAELWRFLHRTTDETSPECKVMESLTEQFTPAYETDPAEAFVAHVVAGLAWFKAEAH